MAYDLDYPEDPRDKKRIAAKASYAVVWPVDESFQASSLEKPRVLEPVQTAEDIRAHLDSPHVFCMNWMDTNKAVIDKKVQKMLIQAQGLDAQPGQKKLRSSQAIRVVDCEDAAKTWPSSMGAAASQHFFIRLTEEGDSCQVESSQVQLSEVKSS